MSAEATTLVVQLPEYIQTTHGCLDLVKNIPFHEKKAIFDVLITARDNVDLHLFNYHMHAHDCFRANTSISIKEAYSMLNHPDLLRLTEIRTDILSHFKSDTYKIERVM
jgi:hypothetical protein